MIKFGRGCKKKVSKGVIFGQKLEILVDVNQIGRSREGKQRRGRAHA